MTEQSPSIGFHRPSIAFQRPAIGYANAPAIGMPSASIALLLSPPHPLGRKNGRLGACGARLPSAFASKTTRENSFTPKRTLRASIAANPCAQRGRRG